MIPGIETVILSAGIGCPQLPPTYLEDYFKSVELAEPWGRGSQQPSTLVKPLAPQFAASSHNASVADQVRSLAALDEDWDGYGASAISDAAIADAIGFLRLLPPVQSSPKVSALGSGEVVLYWRLTGERLADIEFDGSGGFTVFVGNPRGEAELSGEFSISSGVVKGLVASHLA
jgi:hypothetical protein